MKTRPVVDEGHYYYLSNHLLDPKRITWELEREAHRIGSARLARMTVLGQLLICGLQVETIFELWPWQDGEAEQEDRKRPMSFPVGRPKIKSQEIEMLARLLNEDRFWPGSW